MPAKRRSNMSLKKNPAFTVTLRETLPKLLSGELSVANAQEVGQNPENQSA